MSENEFKKYPKQESNRYQPYTNSFRKHTKSKVKKSLDLKELNSLSKIKSKIRDTDRLLKKPNLPSNVKIEIERKLTNLQSLLKDKQDEELRKKFNEQNKGIMFIENKKLNRMLKQLTKQLEDENLSEEETSQLELKLFDTNLNLNYIKYYPIHEEEKYYPLFPSHPKPSLVEKREQIKEAIKVKMLNGEFDDDEEGQSTTKPKPSVSTKPAQEPIEPKKSILNDDFFAVSNQNEVENGQDDDNEGSDSSDSESDDSSSDEQSESDEDSESSTN